ncbi:MAG TPA: hypothetical protein DCW52_06430 [Gammaproteobacteria bacterium]|nr:hypothetical protein [Gammaproteobacteria bacterium]
MTLKISDSQVVSPKTIDIVLRAIKLSNANIQTLKFNQRKREQRLIGSVVLLVMLNFITLMLVNYAPREGAANAVTSNDTINAVLKGLKQVTPNRIKEKPGYGLDQRLEGKPQQQLASSKAMLRSKVIPVLDSSNDQTQTYYGELLSQEYVLEAEQSGRAPHSNDLGAEIGMPSPPRSQRIEELVRTRIPLNTQEILYLKQLVDDNERATYATPDVKQRTVNISYQEGKIPTITVAKNNIATLSFVDKFGNPFPISTMSPKGAGELFTTELVNHDGTHLNVAEIRASKLNGSSNVSIMLKGRTLPAVFKINLSHALNDARTVVQLDSSAPGYEHVSLPKSSQGVQLCEEDVYMEAILDGVIPTVLERLETRVAKMQAYQSQSHNYIRSANQIVDPECTCRIYGVDNLNVCKQPVNIPSILYVDSSNDEFGSLALNRGA